MNVARPIISSSKTRRVALGEILTLVNGRAYKQEELLDAGTPVIRIQNLNGGERWYYSNLDLPDKNYCKEGDLLFAWSATFGPYFWAGPTAIFHYHIWKVLPSEQLDKRYAYYLLQAITDRVKAAGRGISMIHMTKSGMEAWEVDLPPLAEQKRIAAILEKANQLRQKRRQAIALLDSLTQSIFLEMFGDPMSNPRGWKTLKLAGFEEFLTSGSRGWAVYYADQGRPFVRIQNLKNGKLSTDDLVFVNAPENAEARRTTVAAGDVLISITADLGRIAVVPLSLDGRANINQHIALFRPKGINSTYLASYLASSGGKQQFAALNRQGVKAGLNFSDIRRLQIVSPPLELQRKFEQLVISHEAQRDNQMVALREAESLFASLQHRAFSGQL